MAVERVSCWSGKAPEELCAVDNDIVHNITPEDPEIYSIPYINEALAWNKDENRKPVSPDDIEQFHLDSVAALKELATVDPEFDETEAVTGFEQNMWPKLSGMLKEPSFYKWMRNFSMKSPFVITYFVDLSGRAPAMEMAMGYSWDVTGKYRRIPEHDREGYYLRAAEPTFRSFVQRNWFSQQVLLKKALQLEWTPDNHGSGQRKVQVLFLGGGLLPQLRYYDLNIEIAMEMFDVVVYDKDPDSKRSLEEILGRSVESYGIEWHCTDYHEAFVDPKNHDRFDVVLGTGIMSYCQTPEAEMATCRGVYSVLASGGYYACDYQILEDSMLRCVLALQWRNTGLKPQKNVAEARKSMGLIVDTLGFIDYTYEVDIYNKQPAIVNFSMRK